MKILRVSDFTKFPGPRHKKFGDFSGEEFRDTVLIPALDEGEEVKVCLDDVMGYGSSFLEEAFAGLIRKNIPIDKVRMIANNLESKDDPCLVSEIRGYIEDEIKRAKN